MRGFFYLLFLCLTSSAVAQSVDSIQSLQPTLIYGEANYSTPVSIVSIDRACIQLKNTGQEPSFILSQLPSITAYSDAGSTQGYSYYRLRGIDQTRINVTLDGMPLNEPEDQGAYFSNYPDIFTSVSRVDVQRGVGLTKNGTASFAGSVQLYSPNVLLDSTLTTFGAGYGSYNSFRAFGEFFYGKKGAIRDKAFYARASQLYSDGYKYHSGNNSQSLFVSSMLLGEHGHWKFNIIAGNQRNKLAWLGVADTLIAADRRTNANGNEKDRFTQSVFQLQRVQRFGYFATVTANAYYIFLDGNYDFDLNNYLGLPSTAEMFNYAFRSNFAGASVTYAYSFINCKLVGGVHANTYNRRHTGSEQTLGRLYQNTGYKNELSPFVSATYIKNDWNVFVDLQYRHATFDYTGTVGFNRLGWNFFNPKAGVSRYIKNGLLYYTIGRTGREPTRNDMFGGNDDLLADSLGNALLFGTKAEYVVDHELGIRFNYKKVGLNANVYLMSFKNEIVLNGKLGPNGIALTNNVDRSFRTGVELSITYAVNKRIKLINNSSFNYSRIKEQSQAFTPILTPPVIINQQVDYSIGKFIFSLSGRYQSKSFINFANTAVVKNYFLLNVAAHYVHKRYTLSAYLNNITNAKYFNNGYEDFDGTRKYFVQAPINYNIAAKYSF